MKWLLLAIIVGATAFGEVLQALGMRRHGEIHDFRPNSLARTAAAVARSGYIIGAVAGMAVAFFGFMALLSIADLSFAGPATAASYVVETILARLLLREHIDWRRWTGAGLVAFGVMMLAQ